MISSLTAAQASTSLGHAGLGVSCESVSAFHPTVDACVDAAGDACAGDAGDAVDVADSPDVGGGAGSADVADAAAAAAAPATAVAAAASDHAPVATDRPAYAGEIHWATPGLHAVCRALDEALAESGNEALAETDTENAHGLPVAGGSSSNTGDDHYGAAKTAARVSSTTSDRRGEQTSAPERKFLPGGAVDAGTSVEAAGVSTMMMDLDSLEMLLDGDRSCGPRDASPPEVSLGVPSVVAAAGGAYATGEGGILQASDRGADVDEEIAGRGGEDFSTAKMSAGVRGGGGGGRRAEDGGVGGLVEEWTGAGEDRGEDQGGDGAGAESFTPTERGASVGVGVGGGEEGGSAWELVEEWTPCPIGTLPGWSSAPLSVVNQTVPSFI